MPHQHRPDVDSAEVLTSAILLDEERLVAN